MLSTTAACKHGMDTRFCSICNGTSRVVTGTRHPPSGAKQHRKSPVKQWIDYRFDNEGRTLVLTAQFANGWTRQKADGETRKTFCFSGVLLVPWQGGSIKSQMNVFPRPGGVTDEWRLAPDLKVEPYRRQHSPVYFNEQTGEFTGMEKYSDCSTVQASGGILVATIDLLTETGEVPRALEVRLNSGGNLMYERLDNYGSLGSGFEVNFQLRLTFKPPQKPAPIERSFWNEFLPGGRPESNRRKF